jgi:hypothetical protein
MVVFARYRRASLTFSGSPLRRLRGSSAFHRKRLSSCAMMRVAFAWLERLIGANGENGAGIKKTEIGAERQLSPAFCQRQFDFLRVPFVPTARIFRLPSQALEFLRDDARGFRLTGKAYWSKRRERSRN